MDPLNPTVLFLGSTPNKNLTRVIEAVKDFKCRLEIVGHTSDSVVNRLKELNIDYRLSSDLSDDELAEKYATADLILFPSTFEGFGLPIIEANKAGRPIITSNLSPMKEVADGAALLVDPFSIESIRQGLERVLHDPALRKELVKRGLENVKKYDHSSIAREYLSLYSKVLGKKSAESKMAESLI